jgi:hypothetical protein
MGVYIKDMKIPPNCGFCKLAWCCKAGIGEEINLYTRNSFRHPDCPLVEVTKPHGPLIDADKQHKRLQKQVMALYSEKSDKYSYLMDVLYSIHGEPTVIEAEGK